MWVCIHVPLVMISLTSITFPSFVTATMILGFPVLKTNAKGSLVGYTASGLPLYNFTGDALHRTSQSVVTISKSILRQILEEYDSRQIFYYLCINLVRCDSVEGSSALDLNVTQASQQLTWCTVLLLWCPLQGSKTNLHFP